MVRVCRRVPPKRFGTTRDRYARGLVGQCGRLRLASWQPPRAETYRSVKEARTALLPAGMYSHSATAPRPMKAYATRERPCAPPPPPLDVDAPPAPAPRLPRCKEKGGKELQRQLKLRVEADAATPPRRPEGTPPVPYHRRRAHTRDSCPPSPARATREQRQTLPFVCVVFASCLLLAVAPERAAAPGATPRTACLAPHPPTHTLTSRPHFPTYVRLM